MSKMIKAITGLMVLVGMVQASVVSMGSFTQGSVGGTTFSGTSSNGFKATYTTVPTDTRAYGYSTLNGGAAINLALGESLVFSFDWASAQFNNNSANSLMFVFGFDTGTGLFKTSIDLGTPAFTFLSEGRNDTFPMGIVAGGVSWTVAGGTNPVSSAYLIAGNTPTITTTLTRTDAANNWTLSTVWGGKTYTATLNGYAAGDGTVNEVFVGSGAASSGSLFNVGDNYTISNASLNLIPEPATIGMLGLGALIMVILRRMRS